MPSAILLKIISMIEDVKAQPISPIITEFRIHKSQEEIEFLGIAARIVDKVFLHIVENVNLIGMKEIEIAELIDKKIKELGGEGLAFPTIVASGPNGANPHHAPGHRKVREEELIIMDYGAIYGGYCSDITRTVATTRASEEALNVYNAVKEANLNAFKAVHRGIEARKIDETARKTIEIYGLRSLFHSQNGTWNRTGCARATIYKL